MQGYTDMIWFCFFLFRFQHFSFPVTEQSRSGKSVNQRKSGRKNGRNGAADEKRKIKQCKWKQSSWTKPNAISHLCHCYSAIVRLIFFNFSTHFSRACLCVCVRVSENFNKPTLLYNIYSHYSYMCVRFFFGECEMGKKVRSKRISFLVATNNLHRWSGDKPAMVTEQTRNMKHEKATKQYQAQ